MDELDLYLNKKNYLDGIGELNQPTLFEISKIGEDKYNQLIRPFAYTLDILDENFRKQHPNINKNFDIFFIRYDTGEYFLMDEETQRSLLDTIVESIGFFTKKHVYLDNQYQAIVINDDNSTLIHRDNFDILADYILKINHMSRIEIEKLPEFQNDKQKDIYNKIMEGRRRKAQESSLRLVDIVKYVKHIGKSIVPLSELRDMHIYHLYEENIIASSQDSYEKRYKQALAGSDPKDLNLDRHWIYEVKNKQ